MKRIIAVVVVALIASGCQGYVFTKYAAVSKAIKNQTDFIGLSGYDVRKDLGAPNDIDVAWSDDKGLVQIYTYTTTHGTVSLALKDNMVIDVDYVDRIKKP